MINWNWIKTDSSELLMVFLSGVGIYLALLLFTRIMGLRSFAKMSSFDFSITVAFGSILATTLLSKSPSLLAGAFGMFVLYGIQFVVSKTRRHFAPVEHLVDNEPLLIMAGSEILSDQLDIARMTEEDLKSKLRSSGVTHPDQVLAVIFETTGSISVLKKDEEADVDPWIFEGVRGSERMAFNDR